MKRTAQSLTRDPSRSHVIYLENGQTVTCYDHSDSSILEIATRNYSNNGYPVAKILDRQGRNIVEA